MAYDGKRGKTLQELAKEFGITTDLVADNRKERRKEIKFNIKEERRKKAIREGRNPYEEREIKTIQQRYYGTKKKYLAAIKKVAPKEKTEEPENG